MRKRRPDSSSSRWRPALHHLGLAVAGGLGDARGARPEEAVGRRGGGQLVDAEARRRGWSRCAPAAGRCGGPRAPRGCAAGRAGRAGPRPDRPSARHQALTASRSSSTRSEARMSVVTSSIRSKRPGWWKPSTSSPSLVLAERVLELVAVAQRLDGGHDRLDRRGLEAADARRGRRGPGPPSRSAGARRAAPARARPGAAATGSMRSGEGSSSSTESASANERFDLVTRARTRSPGTAPRTNTT